MELADRYGVEMTQIALAWLLTKVESPIVGATKLHHIEGAAKSLDTHFFEENLRYLEEPYVPQNLSGVSLQKETNKVSSKIRIFRTYLNSTY